MKSFDKLFALSIALVSLTSLVVTVTGFAAVPLPVWAGRAIACVNLVSLPLLIYSTVKSIQEKLKAPKAPASGKNGARKKKKKKKK